MTAKAQTRKWAFEANQTIRQLTLALRLVWQSSPALTLANIALLVVQGILPLLALYIMKLVIDAIAVAIITPNTEMDFAHIGLLIGFEGLVPCPKSLFRSFNNLK